MNELKKNYYEGFEGEPEIIVSIEEKGKNKELLNIWDGYFNSIMQKIECVDEEWTSLAYYYNLDFGWYEKSPWKVDDIREAYQQLRNIDICKLQDEEKKVLDSILDVFKYAICNKLNVYISYE